MTTTAFTVEVGEQLPPFERLADFAAWNRYAAVNDEFVPIHMDDAAGRAAGHETAIGMGNLGVAQIHCLLRDWLPERGRIARCDVRFRHPARRGRPNRASGTVTGVAESEGFQSIELRVAIEDDEGTILTEGTATVEIPVAPR